MKSPIETMLDEVEWKSTGTHISDTEETLPYATHEGVFEFAGHKLRCYRLSDGKAIFHADDFLELISSMFGEKSIPEYDVEANMSHVDKSYRDWRRGK